MLNISFCSNEKFQDSDVIVDPGSIMAAGEDTVFHVVVNEPGGNTPINATIIEDALHQSIQDDNTTDGTNLQLAVVNVPEVSDTERANALRVRLLNTQANEVSMEEQVFFLFCKN